MTELDRAALEEARNAANQIGKVRRMVSAIALSALDSPKPSPSALEKIGEQCRQLGAHREATKVFERVLALDPENSKVASLHSIMSGDCSSGAYAEQGPAPFVQLRDFLSDDLHQSLLQQAINDLESFDNAVVYDSSGERFANSLGRRGKVLQHNMIEPYRKLFLPRLKMILQTSSILERLGIPDLPQMRYEIQVTNYADGEYFGRHVDDGFHNPKRKISYVYYLRRAPDCFQGGDLLLHDRRADPNEAQSFTRVLPLSNSIVFFRSSSLHEVLPTFVASDDRQDGRFSVNGWLVQGDEKA